MAGISLRICFVRDSMKAREVSVMGGSALAAYLIFISSSDVSKCDVHPGYLDLMSAIVSHSN